MNLNEEIAYFLRDAQYFLAELQTKKNSLMRSDTKKVSEYRNLRWEISSFMDVLYDSHQTLHGDYAGFFADWTDTEIIKEIEYLREKTGMSNAPWFDFGGMTSTIINSYPSSSEGGDSVNSSTPNYLAYYKTATKISGKPLSQYAGIISDSIEDYFNGVVSSTVIEIPFIINAAFTASEWSNLNPLLKVGQIGYLIEDGKVVDHKVGPGYWNDLSFISSGAYTYDQVVTNEIGDAKGNLNGETIGSILNKMLNPYQVPVLSNFLNNAGGSFSNENILEIGESIQNVTIQYFVSNTDNIADGTPINLSAGGIFDNEGSFTKQSSIDLTRSTSYEPITTTTIEISISAEHEQGTTNILKSYIKFHPRVIWGVSQNTSIVAADLLNGSGLQDRQTKISDSYKHDYTFNQSGYLYIAIPIMLSPTDMSFADVTDKQLVWGIEMEDLGVMSSVNNGVGTYNYQIYRSKYKITESETIISVE